MKKNQFKLFFFFIVLGIALSLFLLHEHFAETPSTICNVGASFDCGVVNKGPYANIDGLSYLLTIEWGLPLPLIQFPDNKVLDLLTANAFFGLLTMVALLGMAWNYYKGKNFLFLSSERILPWMKKSLLGGVLYGGFLFFIQHSVLRTYCLFCLGLDFVLISLLILVWYSSKKISLPVVK